MNESHFRDEMSRVSAAIGVPCTTHRRIGCFEPDPADGYTVTLSRERAVRLADELTRLRALLPKWRKTPWLVDHWELRLPHVTGDIAVCGLADGWHVKGEPEHAKPHVCRSDAMRAAEKWAGLPECEVVE